MTALPILKHDLLLRAARGEPTERPPVWVMRQAGRYLPEFRALRVENDFFHCCRTPELASELTLQPIRRFSGLLDAAIIFSDILVIPQAMGMEVEMVPGKGPTFPDPLNEPADLVRLTASVDVKKELGYVLDAISLTRIKLDGAVPLLGFCGAPWTLMAYMVQGGGSKEYEKAKCWLWDHPQAADQLLSQIAQVAIDFLVAQVRAGAQALQVFDSWAGVLSPADFTRWSLPYLAQIAKGVKTELGDAQVPIILFAKGVGGHALPQLEQTDYDVLALDWTTTPKTARNQTSKTLQGNLDPSLLYAGKDAIRAGVEAMLRPESGGFGKGKHIANLGHGITPGVDPEHLRAFLQAVHDVGLEVYKS